MAVKEAPYYWLECDRCGVESTDGGDYAAWADLEGAMEDALGCEWLIRNGKHYCDDCTVWDDDLDTRVSKSPMDKQNNEEN